MHKVIRIDVKLIGSDVSYPGFGSPPRSTNPKGPPDPGHHVPCDGSWPQSLDGQCLALEEWASENGWNKRDHASIHIYIYHLKMVDGATPNVRSGLS